MFRLRWSLLAAVVAALLFLPTGCGDDGPAGSGDTESTAGADTATTGAGVGTTAKGGEPTGEVVLMTHDSFAMPEDVLKAFEQRTGLSVRLLKAGDAGAMLNQAILTKDNPVADVLYGVDNTFLSRALDEDLFEPYKSALLADVPDELELDPEARVTPIDFGDVCLNYDKEVVAEAAAGQAPAGTLAAPTALKDLIAPEYKGKLVVENPATSSPGLAFLLATIAEFGEADQGGSYSWQQFWRDLKKNDVLAVAGWEDAYYNEFSGGAGEGDRPLVVSYASSPVAEVLFAETPVEQAPTGVVTDGAFRQIEFAGVLKGADNQEGAKKLVEFMLDRQFQEALPESMFVFPANDKAALSAAFTKHTTIPEKPVEMDFREIGANRERWIQEWTEIVGD